MDTVKVAYVISLLRKKENAPCTSYINPDDVAIWNSHGLSVETRRMLRNLTLVEGMLCLDASGVLFGRSRLGRARDLRSVDAPQAAPGEVSSAGEPGGDVLVFGSEAAVAFDPAETGVPTRPLSNASTSAAFSGASTVVISTELVTDIHGRVREQRSSTDIFWGVVPILLVRGSLSSIVSKQPVLSELVSSLHERFHSHLSEVMGVRVVGLEGCSKRWQRVKELLEGEGAATAMHLSMKQMKLIQAYVPVCIPPSRKQPSGGWSAAVKSILGGCVQCVMQSTRTLPNPKVCGTAVLRLQKDLHKVWAIDLLSPYQGIQNGVPGEYYLLTVIEQVSRFRFYRVLPNKESESVAAALRSVFIEVGDVSKLPERIHSDNGTEFQGAVADLCREMNIARSHTPPYTPQANGLTERSQQDVTNLVSKNPSWPDIVQERGVMLNHQRRTYFGDGYSSWQVFHQRLDVDTPFSDRTRRDVDYRLQNYYQQQLKRARNRTAVAGESLLARLLNAQQNGGLHLIVRNPGYKHSSKKNGSKDYMYLGTFLRMKATNKHRYVELNWLTEQQPRSCLKDEGAHGTVYVRMDQCRWIPDDSVPRFLDAVHKAHAAYLSKQRAQSVEAQRAAEARASEAWSAAVEHAGPGFDAAEESGSADSVEEGGSAGAAATVEEREENLYANASAESLPAIDYLLCSGEASHAAVEDAVASSGIGIAELALGDAEGAPMQAAAANADPEVFAGDESLLEQEPTHSSPRRGHRRPRDAADEATFERARSSPRREAAPVPAPHPPSTGARVTLSRSFLQLDVGQMGRTRSKTPRHINQ